MKLRNLDLALCALVALSAGVGCGRDPDTLELFFADELVEAPARTAHLLAVTGTTCTALLSAPHDVSPVPGTPLMRTTTRYPIDPKHEVLAGLPRGTPFALEAAVSDAQDLVVGRACEVVTLAPNDPTALKVQVHALPQCPDKARTELDLTIVLDTSAAMAVADADHSHIAILESEVVDALRPPACSTWSVVVHGHVDPSELLPPTASADEVKQTLEDVANADTGASRTFDAVYKAAGLARARAVCGRRSALLVLAGGPDGGSTGLLEDARVGIVGERGDDTDDLYTYLLAMNVAAYNALKDMVPEGVGDATGAETEYLRTAKLNDAAQKLRALVP